MIRVLLFLHLTALAIGNPFHKYPYVFLLDVGNEELEKVNTEQIRISKQGGSLALRYPAIGNGEDISHVRVSGIDFGTDLKAEIVDGGPGYKYVVLVLMGNQGVDFDAVVTIQTVPVGENLQSISSSIPNQLEEDDANDSAEDLSDKSEEASQKNAELTQESSNVYYAVNEALSGYGNSVHSNQNDGDESQSNQNDYTNQNENQNDYTDDDEENDRPEYANDIKQDSHVQYNEIAEQPDRDEQTNEVYSTNLQDNYSPVLEDQNYAIAGALEQVSPNEHQRPNYNEKAFQNAVSDGSDVVYIEEANENSYGLEDIFSDEYDEDDGNSQQYSDKNNNFIDRSDGSAVAY